ncbi:MAG: hypothetical protein QME68_06060, partial [Elusimicrobiota bacterium]|nr:hypothetical protein [Elusimicrobiota bacterium]
DSYYTENTITVSCAKKLKFVHTGLNLKYMTKNYGKDIYTEIDPVFKEKGYSKNSFGIDLGLLYHINENF